MMSRQSPHDFLNEQAQESPPQQQQTHHIPSHHQTHSKPPPPPPTTTTPTTTAAKVHEQAIFRQRDDDQFRASLLQQRMEMLHALESKTQRTSDEENKLNKLRTEIEFDRRVLEMNSLAAHTHLDETNDENDMDYSPEVRERLATQMRDELAERRRLFEQRQQQQEQSENAKKEEEEAAYAQKLERRFAQLDKERDEAKFRQNMQSLKRDHDIEQAVMKQREVQEQARLEMEEYKRRREDENSVDRLMEMKREEMRLKKHIEMNMRTNSNGEFSV